MEGAAFVEEIERSVLTGAGKKGKGKIEAEVRNQVRRSYWSSSVHGEKFSMNLFDYGMNRSDIRVAPRSLPINRTQEGKVPFKERTRFQQSFHQFPRRDKEKATCPLLRGNRVTTRILTL